MNDLLAFETNRRVVGITINKKILEPSYLNRPPIWHLHHIMFLLHSLIDDASFVNLTLVNTFDL
jgi:hypothetical protein